jgi:hypothetical protein
MLRLESDDRKQGTWRMMLVRCGIENWIGRTRSDKHSAVQNRMCESARSKSCVCATKIQLPNHVSVHRIPVVVDMYLTVETATNVERTGPWLHVSNGGEQSFSQLTFDRGIDGRVHCLIKGRICACARTETRLLCLQSEGATSHVPRINHDPLDLQPVANNAAIHPPHPPILILPTALSENLAVLQPAHHRVPPVES